MLLRCVLACGGATGVGMVLALAMGQNLANLRLGFGAEVGVFFWFNPNGFVPFRRLFRKTADKNFSPAEVFNIPALPR